MLFGVMIGLANHNGTKFKDPGEMQVFTVEVLFQPDPQLSFTDPGSLQQTYLFSRETIDGIRDAYETLWFLGFNPGIRSDSNPVKPRLRLTLLNLPNPGVEMLIPFSGLLDCNPEVVFDLTGRKQYVLYAGNCAYTFTTLDYLQGFFYVFTLFGQSPRSLNLRLYDSTQRGYVEIPYPAGM